MPDFGLTEALEQALQASRKVSIVPPAEAKLASSAASSAPGLTAPAVPAITAPEARMPSVQAPSATPPPDAVQAPPLNPSQPPADIPAPGPAAAAAGPTATPATPDIAAASAPGAPPVQALPEAVPAPVATPVDTTRVAPANKLPPAPGAPPAPVSDVQAAAQRFVRANLDGVRGSIDMTHMPNVNTMQSPDGVKAAILQIADDNRGAIEEARGGPVATHGQLIGLANDLSIDTDTLQQTFDREFGPVADVAAGNQRRAIITAARIVEQNSAGSLIAIADKVAAGTATADEIIQFHQYEQSTASWITRVSGVGAEAGRDLNALGIQVDNTLPAEVRQHIADVLQKNDQTMQQRAAAYKNAGTAVGVANIVHGSFPYRLLVKTPFNLLQRVFINGILSGPPTWAKIFIGNNFNLLMNTADLYAAGIGRGMAGLAARLGGYPTAEEGVTLSDAYAHLHGVISAGADGLRIAGRVLKTGQSIDGIMRSEEDFGANTLTGGQKPILPELRDSYFGGIARVLGTTLDSPGRIIGSVDSFTRLLGARGYRTMMSMKELRAGLAAGTLRPGDAASLMRGMMENPSEEMQEAELAWGSRMTFQTPFPEGGTGEAMQNLLNKAPALRFIFPFMRTATNIFKQSLIERTPLAVFSARLRAQIAAGGFEGDLAKARIATGTAVGSMLAWMAIHDRITGDAPKDPKQRAEWELGGRMPYSIRVTNPITGQDTWRAYTWFEPLATIAGIVADSVQLHSYLTQDDDLSLLDQNTKLADAQAHIMASIIQNTGNKTFMQGAAQFAEMYNDPQRAFSMWADQVGASMVPFSGATKFVRNEQDPYLRQAFSLIDKIKNDLPTIQEVGDRTLVAGSKTLPPRLDVFGEARKTTYGNSILGPMNPLPGSPDEHDELTDEIQRVMDQTHSVPLTMPTQLLALGGSGRGIQGGRGMRLTPDEYYDYVRYARHDPIFNGGTQTFREKLEQVIASPVYQEASPAVRYDLLKSVETEADKAGAALLYKNNDDFRERMTQWTAEKNRLRLGQ